MKASRAVGNLAGKSRFKLYIRRFWGGGGGGGGKREERSKKGSLPAPSLLNNLKEGLRLKFTDSDKPWEVSSI